MQPITLNRSIIDNSPLDPPEPPHIQPPFYGGLLVNTLVGASRTPARITELTVADDNVTGYAAYDASGTLVRAVFARPRVATYSAKSAAAFDVLFDVQYYYWNGTLGSVCFAKVMNPIAKNNPGAAFVKVGPHPVLAAYTTLRSCQAPRPR